MNTIFVNHNNWCLLNRQKLTVHGYHILFSIPNIHYIKENIKVLLTWPLKQIANVTKHNLLTIKSNVLSEKFSKKKKNQMSKSTLNLKPIDKSVGQNILIKYLIKCTLSPPPPTQKNSFALLSQSFKIFKIAFY